MRIWNLSLNGLIALSLFIGVTVFLVLMFFRGYAGRGDSRRELIQFMEQVKVGDTMTQVARVFNSGGYQKLRLVTVSSNLMVARTPYEFGAGNWLLFIDITNATVSVLKVRTEDSADTKPDQSPGDSR